MPPGMTLEQMLKVMAVAEPEPEPEPVAEPEPELEAKPARKAGKLSQ